jgi:hypothetical protein
MNMSAISVSERIEEVSPRIKARIAGVLYLIMIVIGIFDEAFVKGIIIVPSDAAATAANLRSMESLWRFGIVGEMLMLLCAVVLAVILYDLLMPVNKNLALLATLFGMLATTVQAAYSLQLIEALFPLGTAAYLKAFTPEQLNALVSLSLKSHDVGFGIVLLFFGPFFLVSGFLIFRSTYFPRAIGILYQIAGLAYLTNGVVLVLAPHFASRIFAIIALPAFVGETSFCLWLLFKGVNMEQWKAQIAAQPSESGVYYE